MFEINARTKEITMHKGDTGTLTVNATPVGFSFTENDRAIFTVKRSSTEVMRQELEIEDNAVVIEFANSDTDGLRADTYRWDIRFVINPTLDEDGHVVCEEGTDKNDGVWTPDGAPFKLTLLDVVGNI